jgi:hypothetical protein
LIRCPAPAAKIIFHDRDAKFGRAFDDTLRAKGIHVRRSPVKAPNVCAFNREVISRPSTVSSRFIQMPPPLLIRTSRLDPGLARAIRYALASSVTV